MMRRGIAWSLLLWWSACSSAVEPDAAPAAPADVVETADSAASVEDVTEPIEEDTSASVEPTPVPSELRMMVSTLAFPEADENGRVPGFDLDDSVASGESNACGQGDFKDPQGNAGIDNQVSVLTPLFDLVGVGQIHQYLQESIDSSGFFLMFDVAGIDSLEDDPDVSLVFEVGGGTGVLGRDGGLVPNQTMCVQDDSPSTQADTARIDNGVLHARFDELTILVSRFERVYPLTMRGAQLSANMADWSAGRASGVVGGGVSLDELMALVVKMAQNQSNLVETVEPLLAGMGDLPVGDQACGAMSVGLVFDAVPVFFFPDEVACDPCGNDVCDSFESCETCYVDCCPGCGNGQCDEYPTANYPVTVTADGFEGDLTGRLVGDNLKFQNATGQVINLVCDGMFASTQIPVDEVLKHTLQSSGEFKCRTYELVGKTALVSVVDNHTEDCQSCPQDCGECE